MVFKSSINTGSGGGGGSGTVTSVSVTTANGVSGSVATPTTTPAISLTLGDIAPSSVAASGTVTGSNLSGTNTGDQTSVSGNAGTATTLATARAINGVNFDGSAAITIPAAAGTLTGTIIGTTVVTSSLTSVGTLTGLAIAGVETITSTSATALAVASSASSGSVFNVDCSQAAQFGGATLKGGTANGTTTFTAITGSGTVQSFSIASLGTGNLTLTSTGASLILQAGGATQITIGTTQTSFTNTSRNSTANTAFLRTSIASGTGGSSLTAGTEVHQSYDNFSATQTHASSTAITTERIARITPPALEAFQTVGGVITTHAAFSVDGCSGAGVNSTITNGIAIHSPGTAVGTSVVNSYSINLTANTGAANNYIASLNGSAGEVLRARTDGQIVVLNTVTTGGTTGAQTINKPSGTVNFAALATSLVVTNSLVSTSSIIIATVRTDDSAMKSVSAVPTSGSFTLFADVAANAETSVGFLVIN